MHIRATTIQRAIESVQHLLGAMFPLDKREKSGEPVIIHTGRENTRDIDLSLNSNVYSARASGDDVPQHGTVSSAGRFEEGLAAQSGVHR